MDAAAVTAVVAVHLTEARVWACSADHEWDGKVGVDEAVLVDAPPTWFVDSGNCAVDGQMIAVVDALSRLVRQAVREVHAAGTPDIAVLTFPSYWGSVRQRVIAAAARPHADEVELVSTALATGMAFAEQRGRGPGRDHWVVVECGLLGTTVTRLRQVAGELESLSCERSLDLGSSELSDRAGDVAAEIAGLAGTDPIDAVLVADDGDNDELVAKLQTAWRDKVHLVPAQSIARRLARSERQPAAVPEAVPAVRASSWAIEEPPRNRPRVAFLAAGAIGLVVATVVAVVALQHDSPEGAPQAKAVGQQIALGRVRVELPEGWRMRRSDPADASGSSRLEIVATDEPDRRIIVIQTVLNAGSGYDRVVTDLAKQIADGGHSSKLGALEPDVVFGGRRGIAYRESPDVYSQVRWHVIVDRDTQISVGCQSLVGDWEALAGECEELVAAMIVVR
ncbi:type VII secretion-associated protein [Antrihabitans sp. YC2-6]|uniref:type VII secretion-associated protein n=1 Tax=Antrihabitans sp. YC2-6 TaxID=2799498 RepID=UPI0018F77FA4|nr:type VII secretion-associated protein [Antrihabitans sp. YC2-6]MBJ8347466.1 type VII secretion-associated protein [Antrihabitans sp. YC2-6]